MICIIELVLKSLSACEVHLPNTSVLQLGSLVFLVGWWFCVGFLVSFASAKLLHGYTYINTEQEKKMVSNSNRGNQVHTQGSLQSVTTTNCNSMQTARKGYIIFVGERITEP